MRPSPRWAPAAAILLAVSVSTTTRAEDRGRAGGRVNNLKVRSDKIDDVTTVENILKSFVRPGMPEQERARALWTAAVRYRHQTIPPNEFLAADWEAHDPVKILNVYGYCMCCCSAALLEALNRADGREARGRILNGHSVPEVRFGDAWHMFDASLITFFPRSEDGQAASVDEIGDAIAAWYHDHPDYKGHGAKLADLMQSNGWTGWKSKGPALLARCPFYRDGFFPAGTHGWNDTMTEYARRPSEVYEYGYQVGHRALFSLRPGESLEREAGNRGLHVDREARPGWEMLEARAPEKDLAYVKEFLPGYSGGVVGNGVHRYAPDLASDALAEGAEVFENLESGRSPALRPAEVGRPGVVVIPITAPYVYLGGVLTLRAVRRSDADRVAVSISTNNGRGFTPVWAAETTGEAEVTVDLGPKILRRYAYWLKVEILSATPGGAGLDRLEVANDIQHAPRTLAWLGRGRNTITVEADADPALATRTIACRITPDAGFDKNETSRTMGVVFDNLDVRDGGCWWTKGTGTMTVPVEVPGDLRALRLSAQVRARGARDRIAIRASRDAGATWREIGQVAGPTPGTTRTFRSDDWPAGTRRVWLRFAMTGDNTIGIFTFRVDADYEDPIAAKAFRPFTVLHRWREGGREKRHEQTITALPSSYTIDTDADPAMVSVRSEMR